MRLFLALELPDDWRLALGAVGETLATDAGWRWGAPETLHVTLRFLGEVDPARAESARPHWRAAAAGCAAPRVTLGRLGVFPGGSRPRVLWAALEEERPALLVVLAATMERATVEAGFPPEDRPFRPHVTLARARRRARPRAPGLTPTLDAPAFRFEEVVLYRSRLEPAGARYTVLERFPLAAAEQTDHPR